MFEKSNSRKNFSSKTERRRSSAGHLPGSNTPAIRPSSKLFSINALSTHLHEKLIVQRQPGKEGDQRTMPYIEPEGGFPPIIPFLRGPHDYVIDKHLMKKSRQAELKISSEELNKKSMDFLAKNPTHPALLPWNRKPGTLEGVPMTLGFPPITKITGGNPIINQVDYENKLITNTTQNGHIFHGKVEMGLYNEAGQPRIFVHGHSEKEDAPFPRLNEVLGKHFIFNPLVEKLKNHLDPERVWRKRIKNMHKINSNWDS